MSQAIARIEHYLQDRRRRFEAAGFECLHDIQHGDLRLALVAIRTRFAFVSIVPLFLREIFIFVPVAELNAAGLQQLTLSCTVFAQAHLRRKPLWEQLIGQMMAVYVVALLPASSDVLQEYLRDQTPPTIPNGGAVIPVVYDARLNLLHHFQKVPMLGNALYWKYRKGIRRWLATDLPPSSPASLSGLPGQETVVPPTAVARKPMPQQRRPWLTLPSLPRLSATKTQTVAINAERAWRFIHRRRQRQSLLAAVIVGLPAAIFMAWMWGAINGIAGLPLEWLPFIGMGSLVGACVRFAGAGFSRRFAVAGAALTLIGVLLCRLLALSLSLGAQNQGLGNFYYMISAPFSLRLRFLLDSTTWYTLVATGLSVCQGYYSARYRVSAQELSYIADERPPQ